MTVETQVYKVTANGNDSATVFSFSPMVIFQSSDIVVTYTDAAGAETTLSEGTGANAYSVTVSTYPGTGSITYPEDAVTPIATGTKITIKRVLSLEQTVDLENQGGYFPDTQETALDKLVMVDLQQQEELDRALKAAVSDSSVDLTLPAAADRANKYLSFDATGVPQVSTGATVAALTPFILTVVDDTSAAEVRATTGTQEDVITTQGDLVRGSGLGTAERLGIGAEGAVLRSISGQAGWGTGPVCKIIFATTSANTVLGETSVPIDSHSGWSAANDRYVGPIAGYYRVTLNWTLTPAGSQLSTDSKSLQIRKNGTTSIQTLFDLASSTIVDNACGSLTDIISLNGSTDYIDFILIATTDSVVGGASAYTTGVIEFIGPT